MLRIFLFSLFLSVVGADAFAKRLCDVDRIQKGKSDEEVNVTFVGSRDQEITVEEGESLAFHSLKGGALTSNGKNVGELGIKRGKRMFSSHGVSTSCVVIPEEREGKMGVYIEEQTVVRGRPPQLRSEFVELE